MLRKNDFVTARKCPPHNRKNGFEDFLEDWLVKDPRSGVSVRTSDLNKEQEPLTLAIGMVTTEAPPRKDRKGED